MTCKKHPQEIGVGVCASCLRERLFSLIASQNKLASSDPNPNPNPNPPLNPHLPFPRSASPYFSHRRSIGTDAPSLNPNSICSRSDSSDPRSSFSWISALIRRKRLGKSPPLARYVEEEEEEGGGDSGYSSDCSAVGRLPGPTPIRAPAVRRSRTGFGAGGRGFSGFAVCLSPLVRSNPNRRRGEMVNGQIRRQVSFGERGEVGVNRSRKFADFGRFK